jgi:hypothetical protein
MKWLLSTIQDQPVIAFVNYHLAVSGGASRTVQPWQHTQHKHTSGTN